MASQYPPSVTRWASKANTQGVRDLGNASLSKTSGAGYTSWGQIAASTSSDGYVTGIYLTTTATAVYISGAYLLVDLAVGGSGSESAVATVGTGVTSNSSATSDNWGVFLPVDPAARISASTRVSARIYVSSITGTTSFTVGALWTPYTALDGN